MVCTLHYCFFACVIPKYKQFLCIAFCCAIGVFRVLLCTALMLEICLFSVAYYYSLFCYMFIVHFFIFFLSITLIIFIVCVIIYNSSCIWPCPMCASYVHVALHGDHCSTDYALWPCTLFCRLWVLWLRDGGGAHGRRIPSSRFPAPRYHHRRGGDNYIVLTIPK